MTRFIKTTNAAADNGTSRQGTLNADFREIHQELGDPCFYGSGDDKVSVTWILQFEDGTIATIYDYKSGCDFEEVTSWSIGGHSKKAVERAAEIFGKQASSLYA